MYLYQSCTVTGTSNFTVLITVRLLLPEETRTCVSRSIKNQYSRLARVSLSSQASLNKKRLLIDRTFIDVAFEKCHIKMRTLMTCFWFNSDDSLILIVVRGALFQSAFCSGFSALKLLPYPNERSPSCVCVCVSLYLLIFPCCTVQEDRS